MTAGGAALASQPSAAFPTVDCSWHRPRACAASRSQTCSPGRLRGAASRSAASAISRCGSPPMLSRCGARRRFATRSSTRRCRRCRTHARVRRGATPTASTGSATMFSSSTTPSAVALRPENRRHLPRAPPRNRRAAVAASTAPESSMSRRFCRACRNSASWNSAAPASFPLIATGARWSSSGMACGLMFACTAST